MPGIAVISNARSRRNRRHPGLLEELAAILGDSGSVHSPADLDALEGAITELRARAIDILAINGGDGTAHVVFGALMRVYGDAPLPGILLLRGGTMNTVASGLGLRGTPTRILRRAVRRYRAGELIPEVSRNLIRILGERPQYGFIFGNGLIANFLEVYYEGREPSPQKAVWVVVRAITSALFGGALFRRLMRPLRVEIEADGECWPSVPYLAVGAGTVDDIGFRFRPFHRAPANPDRLHAVAFGCSPLALLGQLLRIWRGRPTRHPAIRDTVAQRVRLRAETPIAYTLDGDLHVGQEALVLEAGPRLRLLLP